MKTITLNSKGQMDNNVKDNQKEAVANPPKNLGEQKLSSPIKDKAIVEEKAETNKVTDSVTAKPTEMREDSTQRKAEPVPNISKPSLNLEGTLKLVEELHRRKIQRDKLIDTIDTLEAFDVAQKDEKPRDLSQGAATADNTH